MREKAKRNLPSKQINKQNQKKLAWQELIVKKKDANLQNTKWRLIFCPFLCVFVCIHSFKILL